MTLEELDKQIAKAVYRSIDAAYREDRAAWAAVLQALAMLRMSFIGQQPAWPVPPSPAAQTDTTDAPWNGADFR